MAVLVVKEAKINEKGPVYVKIKGRKSGFIAWLLNLIRVDATTTLEIYENRVEFTEGSLYGRLITLIPLSALCTVSTGYVKPFTYLILAAICLILTVASVPLGMAAAAVLPLILAIIFGVLYFLKKTISISITPNSGQGASIRFKRSVIEGVNIDEKEAYKIIAIINALFLRQTRNSGDAVLSNAVSGDAISSNAGSSDAILSNAVSGDIAMPNQQKTSNIAFCTGCGNQFKGNESFCMNCGAGRK